MIVAKNKRRKNGYRLVLFGVFVDFVFELACTLEGDNPSFFKHHGIPCGGIPSLSGGFINDLEFPEPGNHNIFTRCQSGFYNFNQGF